MQGCRVSMNGDVSGGNFKGNYNKYPKLEDVK